MPSFAIASRKKRTWIRLPTSRPNRSGSAVITVWMLPSPAARASPARSSRPRDGSGIVVHRAEQRELRRRTLVRGRDRILVGEARVAEAVLEPRTTTAQALEREVAERVRAHDRADLLGGVVVCDQLLARGRVDPVVA